MILPDDTEAYIEPGSCSSSISVKSNASSKLKAATRSADTTVNRSSILTTEPDRLSFWSLDRIRREICQIIGSILSMFLEEKNVARGFRRSLCSSCDSVRMWELSIRRSPC